MESLEEIPEVKDVFNIETKEVVKIEGLIVKVLTTNYLTKEKAIKELRRNFSYVIRGFVGDNQIFLEIKDQTGKTKLVYLCDLPSKFRSNCLNGINYTFGNNS